MCCSGEKKLLSEEGARIVRRILKTLTKLLLDYMEGEEGRKREGKRRAGEDRNRRDGRYGTGISQKADQSKRLWCRSCTFRVCGQ